MPEFLQPLVDAVSNRPYLFIFIGLLVAGEVVLIPAIYFAVTGHLELGWVLLSAIAAMAISDLVWYYLGRALPRERLKRIGRIDRAMSGLEKLYARRGPQILIGSKFVYGTRTAAQVLAGTNGMPVSTYLAANTVGIALLVVALCAMGYLVHGTVDRMTDLVGRMQVAFLVFVALAVAIHLVAAKVLRAKWSR
jgi:membrane protein DedA with SNARE-associated domain